MKHVDLRERFKQLSIEVEMGFDLEQTAREVERCLNCDVQTAFTDKRCIECDACVDVCPTSCLTITANGEEPELRQQPDGAGGEPDPGALRLGRAAADRAGDGQGRGRLRPLRPVRRALPDGGLGHGAARAGPAEGGTAAGAARRSEIGVNRVHQQQVIRTNDFALKLANVNGTGSASANGLLMQAIFRMGIPVSGKNLFPSNIQGLPTWYEMRVNKAGHTARALDYDLVVAMNAETYARDVKEVRSGGTLLYDSSWPLDAALSRPDVTFIGVPLAKLCNEIFHDSRERILMKNIAYLGALVALLDIDMDVIEELLDEKFAKKKALRDSNHKAIRAGYDYAIENFDCPLPIRLEKMHATDDRILIDGNTATALGCLYAGATVAAWYPITPATSVMDSFKELCAEYRKDPGDRQEQLLHRAGRGRAGGDRDGDRRVVERRARLHLHGRPRHLAHERAHRPRLLRRDSGGDRRRAAHRAVDRDADAHAAGGHPRLRLRLARRHQAHPAVSLATRPSASRWRSRPSTWPSGSRRRSSSSRTSTSA